MPTQLPVKQNRLGLTSEELYKTRNINAEKQQSLPVRTSGKSWHIVRTQYMLTLQALQKTWVRL